MFKTSVIPLVHVQKTASFHVEVCPLTLWLLYGAVTGVVLGRQCMKKMYLCACEHSKGSLEGLRAFLQHHLKKY